MKKSAPARKIAAGKKKKGVVRRSSARKNSYRGKSAPKKKLTKKKASLGLVLSGGAAYGSYQAGILKAFHQSGVTFKVIAGASIGAMNGYMAASDQIDKLEEIWKNMGKLNLLNVNSLPTLLFSRSPSLLKDEVQRKFANEYVDLNKLRISGKELITAAISLDSGEIKYFSSLEAESSLDLRNMILASAAIPGIFPPVVIDHHPYMDGGLLGNTPLEAIIKRKLDKVVVISMEPVSYKEKEFQHMGEIALRAVSIFFRHQAMRNFQQWKFLQKINKKLPDLLVMQPAEPLPMQQYQFDPEKIKAGFEKGYADGLAFLKKHRL